MRRKLSLRGRMVMTAVVATAVALALLLLLAAPRLERQAREDAYASLTAQARLMARVAEDALGGAVPEEDAAVVADDEHRVAGALQGLLQPSVTQPGHSLHGSSCPRRLDR